jgi:integrase
MKHSSRSGKTEQLDPATATIHDAADIWVKRCRGNELERSTLGSYEQHVRCHILPYFADSKLGDLTPAQVQDFVDDMMSENSHAMTGKVLRSLKAVLKCAVTRGLIPHNVASEISLRRRSRIVVEKIIPSKDEIRLLLDRVDERFKPFLVCALFTGMRSSELRGLTWGNVDFDKHIILVRQRADRWNKMGPPKSRSGHRDIPMAPIVYSILKVWRKACPKGELGLVFPNGVGKHQTHGNIYHRRFRPLMLNCELVNEDGKPKFSIHALRHACASLLIDQQLMPKKIQRILGHATMAMTFDTYGHLFDRAEDDVELMAKLENDLFAA